MNNLLRNAYRVLRKNYSCTPAEARALLPFTTIVAGSIEDEQATWETNVLPIYKRTEDGQTVAFSFIATPEFVAAATNLEMTGGV